HRTGLVRTVDRRDFRLGIGAAVRRGEGNGGVPVQAALPALLPASGGDARPACRAGKSLHPLQPYHDRPLLRRGGVAHRLRCYAYAQAPPSADGTATLIAIDRRTNGALAGRLPIRRFA